jgi:16S rRNA (uracil1498-N3)-methyltransferase
VVEQRDRPAIATFFTSEPLAAGRTTALGETEAHHVNVRRMSIGDPVRLVDGAGAVACGTVAKLSRTQALVSVESVEHVEPLAPIHLIVPIADRERMLWLAEKAAELGIASWRPVLWRRSRSVSPRGEGVGFQRKVRARMTAALTQSGGAWLPAIYPDATLDRVIASCPAGARWLLDAEGEPMVPQPMAAPVTIAVGPEGGVETAERTELIAAGFTPVKLAPLTLRFETAGVAALSIARAALHTTLEKSRA